ncbi:MAG: tetratricopeptide repeat protein [Candidatus Thorarchaeota archaeon]
MSQPTLKELTIVEELFEAGKLEEALELLNGDEVFEGLNFEQKSYYGFLKGLILLYQNKNLKLIELGKSMLREGQELKDQLYCFDGLFFISMGLDQGNRFEEALNKIGEANTVIEQISNVSEKEISQRKFRLEVLKTMVDIHTGNMDRAEKNLDELLHSQDELDITWELIWALTNMAFIKLITRGKFDEALEYTERAMTLAKKYKYNHYWIGYCHLGIGVVYFKKCEYGLSLKHHIKSLEYFKKINNIWYIAHIYNNLGSLYCTKGEYDIALKYLEEAIILWEPYPLMKYSCLDTLIWVSLEKGDDSRAQKYFQELEDIYNENKLQPIEVLYKINKARLLKKSSRIRDKAKAEDLFKEILENQNLPLEIKIAAYVNLCDLLLGEYRLNNNNEVLEEIKQNLNDLTNIAENSRSYDVFCNTFILQAKLALLNFEMKTARRFLTQAQKIAESHGLKLLAMKISHEHDELLKQTKLWEKLKDSEASLPERWNIAGLNEQIEILVKNRMIEVPELSEEQPILLLVLEEAGVTIFSHIFTKEWSHDDDLVGGFLSAINSFSGELFSEGLDRAKFGQHTVLMKSFETFSTCYLFKGDSYPAQKKINNFIEQIQNSEEIKETFNSYYKTHKSIGLKENPALKLLLTDIFIHKN